MAYVSKAKSFDEDAARLCKGPLSRTALKWSYVMRDRVARTKEPGFTRADWAPIEDLIATDEFLRVGNWREKVNWEQYIPLVWAWAEGSVWDFTPLRYTEGDGYAIQELEEYAVYPHGEEIVNSVSIYEFNYSGKITGLSIFLSKAEPVVAAQSNCWDWKAVSAEIVWQGQLTKSLALDER
jgi:hypothetical protein